MQGFPLIHAILVVAQLSQATPQPEEQFRVPLGPGAPRVFLRHLLPNKSRAVPVYGPVLILHGSTLPSSLSAAARIDGVSWMDDLARRGFDVWALDFLGFGGSDRYPEMSQDPSSHAPLGRARDAIAQVDAAVTFVLQRTKRDHLALLAHSWGTIPAALYSARAPEKIAKLVLFGPVVTRSGVRDSTPIPAWSAITPEARLAGLFGLPPKGAPRVLAPDYAGFFRVAYLASDAQSYSRNPPAIALPSGPDADLRDAWSGVELYDASRIVAPVLIVRGEWDEITTDADARRLFDALHNTIRRDVKISGGTHVMQLERSRRELYTVVAAFLSENFPARASQ
jgi:pimeloyl-ACP methyl ester carboxylesterase